MGNIIDLSGQRRGHLKILERDTSKPSKQGIGVWWLCECDCGKTVTIRSDALRHGQKYCSKTCTMRLIDGAEEFRNAHEDRESLGYDVWDVLY